MCIIHENILAWTDDLQYSADITMGKTTKLWKAHS